MAKSQLTGLDKVLRNLNREIKKIEHRTLKGLIRAVIVIRRDMDKTPPRVPVGDTGNLRLSFFTVTSEGDVTEGASPNFIGDDVSELTESQVDALAEAEQIVAAGARKGPLVVFGFGAYYALIVHEMVGENVEWQRAGAGAEFARASIRRNKGKILALIREEARIR